MEIIVGAVVSLIVQAIKKYIPNTLGKLTAVLVLSVIGAAGFFYFQQLDFWQDFVAILTSAGAFYAFVLRQLEE